LTGALAPLSAAAAEGRDVGSVAVELPPVAYVNALSVWKLLLEAFKEAGKVVAVEEIVGRIKDWMKGSPSPSEVQTAQNVAAMLEIIKRELERNNEQNKQKDLEIAALQARVNDLLAPRSAGGGVPPQNARDGTTSAVAQAPAQHVEIAPVLQTIPVALPSWAPRVFDQPLH